MSAFNDPYNRQSLIQTLNETHDEAKHTFKILTLDNFYKGREELWSAGETLRHLISSEEALISAMKIPKMILWFKFGKAKQPSRTYQKMRETYQEKLAGGAKATGRFLPEKIPVPSTQREAEDMKIEMLHQWSSTGRALTRQVTRWHEIQIEKYVLPHPLLGKLTVREMLMFTIYHNLHHTLRIQQRFKLTKN